MSFTFDLPWNKYGIIVDLAKRLECVSPQFGKTALQKTIILKGFSSNLLNQASTNN